MCITDYKVVSVIVTFNPNISAFIKILDSIVDQVDKVIIVDNASTQNIAKELNAIVHYEKFIEIIPLPENVGIGAAQNEGIKHAEKFNYTHILFLDHDSIPENNMVQELLKVERQLLKKGINIGAVGPTSVDRRTGTISGFVKRDFMFIKRIYPKHDECAVEADFLISSGTLTRKSVLDSVGLLNPQYFIDHVDTEWCFRVKQKNYHIYGSNYARLYHQLGEDIIRIWFLRWRELPQHKGFRYYYIFRNTIFMIRNTKMSLAWKLTHLQRLVMFAIIFTLVGDKKKEKISMVFKGITDGIKGKMGKMK